MSPREPGSAVSSSTDSVIEAFDMEVVLLPCVHEKEAKLVPDGCCVGKRASKRDPVAAESLSRLSAAVLGSDWKSGWGVTSFPSSKTRMTYLSAVLLSDVVDWLLQLPALCL